MKKAFTLFELVMVIVVIGIISAVMVPRVNNVQIDKAAQQLLDHIRYTQHLAMIHNRFDPADPDWYKKRWQMFFQTDGGRLSYSIFADENANGSVNANEIARDPLNETKQVLTGLSGFAEHNKKLQLATTYSIQSISFSHCHGSKRLYFDYLGRPMAGNPASLDSVYVEEDTDTIYLLQDEPCKITLTDTNDNELTIAIEPETGYAYIDSIDRNN